jgi:hypothetical protein
VHPLAIGIETWIIWDDQRIERIPRTVGNLSALVYLYKYTDEIGERSKPRVKMDRDNVA